MEEKKEPTKEQTNKKERQKFLNPEHPFQVFMTTVFNLILVNLLTLLTSIPVLTAGAAFTAMSGTLIQMAEGDDYKVTAKYFQTFKSCFQEATMLYLLYLPVLMIDLGYAALTLTGLIKGNSVLFGILMIVSLLLIASAVYSTALTTRYENTALGTFRNSFLLAFGYLPRTAVAVVSFVLMALLLYVTWPYLGSIGVLFGFSLPGYIAVRQVLPVLEEQEGKQ